MKVSFFKAFPCSSYDVTVYCDRAYERARKLQLAKETSIFPEGNVGGIKELSGIFIQAKMPKIQVLSHFTRERRHVVFRMIETFCWIFQFHKFFINIKLAF